MTISEVVTILKISVHTLRYYEKIGLIRQVSRTGGRRNYSKMDLTWLEFILRLKRTRMPLQEIRHYADLWYEGNETIPQRKTMLLAHRQRLQSEMVALQDHMDILEKKITLYETQEKQGGFPSNPEEAWTTCCRSLAPGK